MKQNANKTVEPTADGAVSLSMSRQTIHRLLTGGGSPCRWP
jgi:hypothetical protein